jgi:hypothetical protein
MNNNKHLCYHQYLISNNKENVFLCPNINDSNLNRNSDIDDYFMIFQNLMTNIIDFSILYLSKKDYIKKRKKTILMLKEILINYSLSDKTFHLAISLLDSIFMKINAINEMNIIAIFCLIIASKFIENDSFKSTLLEQNYSKQISSNYKNDEIYILKLIDYNLNITTAYDVLNLILTQQNILFDGEEKKNKFSTHHMAIVYLNKLIENEIILTLNPIEISFGIIQLIRKRLKLIPENKEIYKLFFKDYNNKNFTKAYLIFYNLFCNKNKRNENKQIQNYENEKNYQILSLKKKNGEFCPILVA